MANINLLKGDTLEAAQVGDTVTNLYGEQVTITGERGSVWIVERVSVRKHANGSVTAYYEYPMFKYDPSKAIVEITA